MNPDKSKAPKPNATNPQPPATRPSAAAKPPAKPPGAALPGPLPPLFRPIDWMTLLVTTVLVFIGYLLTISPDLTMEDCGELATGSFYCAVPHPPGYPVWTIYSWLFTKLLPISNIAFRVSVSSAVAGACACGLLALLVSRGCSMMLESIPDLKNIDRRWESAFCMVSGWVAGTLIGFNGFMWSQSVIVEVYPFSLLSFMAVLCCMLRWIYTPDRYRYLYWALFLFGICFTNHQTLILSAMGLEVIIAAIQPKLGRDLFLMNSAIYIVGLLAKANGLITTFDNNVPLFVIYNAVGIGSLLACGWFTLTTQKLLTEWKPVVIMTALWILGAMFYFYMPLTSMTNPPMNWGYPRTWDGFLHALTRGQYERTNPTNSLLKLFSQALMYLEGAVEEFNLVYLLLALVPFVFFARLQKRERGWLIGLVATWVCLAVLLMMMLNPTPDRQSRELTKVFFVSSHTIIAMCVGYGLALIGGLMAVNYSRFRFFGIVGSAVAAGVAVYAYLILEKQAPLPRYTAIFGIALAFAAVATFALFRNRAPLAIMLVLFTTMPTYSILAHWEDNEQRGHLFGFWFGHDMFTPPFGIYPEMTKDAVLFGGTDPGRFCPTYMIFCESFIPPEKKRDPKFDRRDVYIITQNALADPTYLEYIRAHYNRSAQIDPPFFQEMLRTRRDQETGRTNPIARMAAPLDRFFTNFGANVEKRRRAEGLYPREEIGIPSAEDSQKAFQDYIADAQRRLAINQLKPGEDVKIVDNRVQVTGQVAVMAINGLLTKVIFDHTPNKEFFVEESFPLDWMYPYETPFGIIMKINRQPVPELTQDIVDKDHKFWSLYSDRLIGNWITYDTPVSNICAFAERVYLRRDYQGFIGDPKFIRDDVAQKAFSKLRSSIAGVYTWRLGQAKNDAERGRMQKEADFAFRQAFAYCPYSPEAVFRYASLLASVGRLDDALLVLKTCQKFDLDNETVKSYISQLEQASKGQITVSQAQNQLKHFEQEYKNDPTNARIAFELASAYIQLQRTNDAVALLDGLMANPRVDVNAILSVAQAYAQLGQAQRLEKALIKLVSMTPDNAEGWYDLATIQVALSKNPEAVRSLGKSLEISRRRIVQQPASKDLVLEASNDARFTTLRPMPEFQKIIKGN